MMINFSGRQYLKVMIQIFLVVSFNMALSYVIHEADKNLVSAASGTATEIVNEIVHTCVEAKNGEICQEYLADECPDLCKSECLPLSREGVVACELGTCFDSEEGLCLPNSPRKKCEDLGGEFIEEGDASTDCDVGCCVIGGNTEMTTEGECMRAEENLGVEADFMPELNPGECAELSQTNVVGACIFDSGSEENMCRLKTRLLCYSQNGFFYPNMLCSHPAFDSGCEAMEFTSCVEGRDEIFWFDSCGNRENIYEGSSESQKTSSWNNGMIKSKDESCILGTEDNQFQNQGTCGNCNRFDSSICGEKTSTEKLDDDEQGFVCKNLNCIDEDGNARLHGETWCEYEGRIKPTDDRATMTPGSRHFVMQCWNGEISINENCADQRTEICLEDRDAKQAGCYANDFTKCILYNKGNDMDDCKDNPVCFVKKVKLKDAHDRDDTDFKFEVCVPKYPGGFGFGEDVSDLAKVCDYADVTCKVAKVKTLDDDGIGTHWEWINRGCTKKEFIEQMNDFCMSLGDCGASVNYIGNFEDDDIKVKGGPSDQVKKLSNSYINKIEDYDKEKEGEYIKHPGIEEWFENMGSGKKVPFKSSIDDSFPPTPEGYLPIIDNIINNPKAWGSWGLGFLSLAKLTPTLTSGPFTYLHFGGYAAIIGSTLLASSIVSWYLNDVGIMSGLNDFAANLLVAAAGTSGLLLSLQIVAPQTWGGIGWASVWIMVSIVVITIILDIMGVGDVKEYTVKFDCDPWTPPKGGDDCHKCTDNPDIPCTEYACESLGTTCQLINEGTFREECAHVPTSPGGPLISPLYDVKVPGTDYVDVSENVGFKIVHTETEDGCLPVGTFVNIGINLTEAGRCTYSLDEGVIDWLDAIGYLDYLEETEDLSGVIQNDVIAGLLGKEEFYFGGNSLYLREHVQPFIMPSFADIGELDFDPEARIPDFDMVIKCEDLEGDVTPYDYTVRFCISPRNRTIDPRVRGYIPRDGLLLSNVTTANFSIYTDYPSDCKWSLEDKKYSEMENDFTCMNNPKTDAVPLYLLGLSEVGFRCDSEISMEGKEEEKIYVRCMDQPWFDESDPARNIMLTSYEVDLERTAPLEITSLKPSGETLNFGTIPAVVNLEIETEGGAENGEAVCYYLAGSDYAMLETTGGTSHRQVFDRFTGGTYKIYTYCEDIIGNAAEKVSDEFTIHIDNEAPDVVKAFVQSGVLKVITDEPATCYYSNRNCVFDMSADDEDATLMSIGLTKEHSTTAEYGKTYYIRCQDGFDNYRSGCSQIIKTWSF